MMICFSGSSRASLSGRRPRPGWRWGRGEYGGGPRGAGRAEPDGEVGRGDLRPLAQGHAALDDALQLADVARPVVAGEQVEGVGREADDRLGEVAGEPVAEVLGQPDRCRCPAGGAAGASGRRR